MNIKNIPHVRQSSAQRNCGAACICMLLQYYHRKGKLKDVTTAISKQMENGLYSCRNSLILEFAEKENLNCAVVSVDNFQSVLPILFRNNIDVVIAYRPNVNSALGHYAVVTGYDDTAVYINDPEKDAREGKNFRIPFSQLDEQMRPLENAQNFEIVKRNILVLLSNPNSAAEYSSIECQTSLNGNLVYPQCFTCVKEFVNSILFQIGADGDWADVIHESASGKAK